MFSFNFETHIIRVSDQPFLFSVKSELNNLRISEHHEKMFVE